ncbi:MAG: nicotinate-nucleotide adenylyltransferase, partial [Anaerolineales bacterium]
MRIGIFGGTFDPPHIGHLILAQDAIEQMSLDHVLWVLTPFPPHKIDQIISPLQDRVSMVLLAITGNKKFKFSRVDINRQPPHYAADTVSLLRNSFPKDEFYYLMGADSLNDLPTWHTPDLFVSLCHGIGIMVRQDESFDITQLEIKIPGLSRKLHFLETPIIEVSGSDIRKRVSARKQFRYFVPDMVFQYILDHKLYQV